jgi:hypothetical protein
MINPPSFRGDDIVSSVKVNNNQNQEEPSVFGKSKRGSAPLFIILPLSFEGEGE